VDPLVSEAAPPGQIGFMIGLAMAINQLAVVTRRRFSAGWRDFSGTYVIGWCLLMREWPGLFEDNPGVSPPRICLRSAPHYTL